MKILIADDTPTILDVLQQILEMDGYDVVTTTEGNEVLHLLHAEHPDLLLLDFWLTGSNGVDICKEIKQQESLSQIPVLLLSAHRDVEQKASQARADGFIQKPFVIAMLLSTIAKALQTSQKQSIERGIVRILPPDLSAC